MQTAPAPCHSGDVDAELLQALAAAQARAPLVDPPADAGETVRRWAAAQGLAPGRYAAVSASGAAELVTRWAAARGWPAVTAREAAAALRAAGYRRTRAGGGPRGLFRVARAADAARLRDEEAALQLPPAAGAVSRG